MQYLFIFSVTLLITIAYATIEKPYASIVSFANSNTFSLVPPAYHVIRASCVRINESVFEEREVAIVSRICWVRWLWSPWQCLGFFTLGSHQAIMGL